MTNETVMVSVIIPTYQNFIYIKDTISSIFKQNFLEIELIISDDNSDNFPLEYFNELTKKPPLNIKRVKVIRHYYHYGLVKNLNDAIKNSIGDIIICIGQDDEFYSNDVISEIVAFYNKFNPYIITGKRAMYKNEKQIEIRPNEIDTSFLNLGPLDLYRIISTGNFINGAATYYSRKFFIKYGLFNEKYVLVEDFPTYLSALRQGCRVHFLDKIFIKKRTDNSTGLITEHHLQRIDDSILTYENEILNFKSLHNKAGFRLIRYKYLRLFIDKYFLIGLRNKLFQYLLAYARFLPYKIINFFYRHIYNYKLNEKLLK